MAKKKTAKRKTSKRAPTKRAPAKRTPAKSTPAKRVPAKRTPAKKPTPRRRKILRGLFLLAGIGIGVLIPWLAYLDYAVTSAFDGRKWDLPSRVYARALSIYPGLPTSIDYLVTELRAAGYSRIATVSHPGEYSLQGNNLSVYNRAFLFDDGNQPWFRFSVQVKN